MLECFKNKSRDGKNNSSYYLNGVKVKKSVAEAYARANKKSLPSCVKRTSESKSRSLSKRLKFLQDNSNRDITQLRSENDKLILDNSKLKSELDSLVSLLQSVTESVKVRDRICLSNEYSDKLSDERNKLMSNLELSMSQIESLNLDNSDKEKLITDLSNTQSDLMNNISRLNIEVETVKTQNDLLKDQVSNLMDVVDKNKRLEEIIAINISQIEQMNSEAENYKSTIEENYNRERSLIEKTEQLVEKSMKCDSDLFESKQEYEKLRVDLEELSKEYEKLEKVKALNVELINRIKELNRQISTKQSELEKLERETSDRPELLSRVKDLTNIVEELNREINIVKQSLQDEKDMCSRNISTYKMNKEQLQTRYDELVRSTSDQPSLIEQVKNLSSVIIGLNDELRDARDLLENEKDKCARNLEISQNRYVELERATSDRPSLINRVGELSNSIGLLSEDLNRTKTVLEEERDMCVRKIDKILEDNRDVSRRDASETDKNMRMLQSKIEEYEVLMNECNANKVRVGELMDKSVKCDSDLISLQERLETEKDRYLNLETETSDRPQLLIRVEELSGMVAEMDKELKKERDELVKEKDKCIKKVDKALEESYNFHKKDKDILDEKIVLLEKKIEEYDKLIKEYQDIKRQIEGVTTSLEPGENITFVPEYFSEKEAGNVKKEVEKIEKKFDNATKKAIRCGKDEYFDTQLRRCNKRFRTAFPSR